MFLTHGAVSHPLEAELGSKLFHRAGRSMLPTKDGRRLIAWRTTCSCVAKGIAEVRADDRPQTLNFSAPFWLAKWLIPRLADFRRRHPKLEANLSAEIELVDFSRDEVDHACVTNMALGSA